MEGEPEYGCTCPIGHPPCGFCTSLTEEEADIHAQYGSGAVYLKEEVFCRSRCVRSNTTPVSISSVNFSYSGIRVASIGLMPASSLATMTEDIRFVSAGSPLNPGSTGIPFR